MKTYCKCYLLLSLHPCKPLNAKFFFSEGRLLILNEGERGRKKVRKRIFREYDWKLDEQGQQFKLKKGKTDTYIKGEVKGKKGRGKQ